MQMEIQSLFFLLNFAILENWALYHLLWSWQWNSMNCSSTSSIRQWLLNGEDRVYVACLWGFCDITQLEISTWCFKCEMSHLNVFSLFDSFTSQVFMDHAWRIYLIIYHHILKQNGLKTLDLVNLFGINRQAPIASPSFEWVAQITPRYLLLILLCTKIFTSFISFDRGKSPAQAKKSHKNGLKWLKMA